MTSVHAGLEDSFSEVVSRPYYVTSTGFTDPHPEHLRDGWLFINFGIMPDLTVGVFFGYIPYVNGSTTITNVDSGETRRFTGPHTLIMFKFFGSQGHVRPEPLVFTGHAVFACGFRRVIP